MNGYYNNGGNFNYSGYSQQPLNNNLGSYSSCPGGNCPRLSDHGKGQDQGKGKGLGQGQGQGQGLGMGSQHSCPGGQCLNGQCSIGRSGSNRNWQNYGR